jgi:hypothetical protein
MRHHRRLSDSERERDRQRLKQATEQLLSSEGWLRWVRVRSRNGLARYSVNNQLIIALSRPDASYVCGSVRGCNSAIRSARARRRSGSSASIPPGDLERVMCCPGVVGLAERDADKASGMRPPAAWRHCPPG